MSVSAVRRFPAILFAVGTCAATGGLVRALAAGPGRAPGMAAVLIAAYLGWVFLEVRVSFRTAGEPASEDDRGSELLYGLARLATVLAAVYGPLPRAPWQPWMLVPAALLSAGAALRLLSIRALGRFYSHRVRTVEGHRIADGGPYRLLRHPAYAGMLLAHLGLVSFFCNPVSVVLLLGAFLPAIVYRIRVEERMLYAVEGYRAFALGRKRLVPFVW
ncbi:isoprenylcysteine carboxylmethyltransferase family protein [Streptomyces sp. JHA26]|uniref:methyltransferase family protein n=1 Tax=Streptomyces sp. JHA26 TaxID=1917143 RepID=UPI00098ABEF3|nr:isoprenylcysteine carboxylmethyltransferase family protein [Streptomyces sp. JHA26]